MMSYNSMRQVSTPWWRSLRITWETSIFELDPYETKKIYQWKKEIIYISIYIPKWLRNICITKNVFLITLLQQLWRKYIYIYIKVKLYFQIMGWTNTTLIWFSEFHAGGYPTIFSQISKLLASPSMKFWVPSQTLNIRLWLVKSSACASLINIYAH